MQRSKMGRIFGKFVSYSKCPAVYARARVFVCEIAPFPRRVERMGVYQTRASSKTQGVPPPTHGYGVYATSDVN